MNASTLAAMAWRNIWRNRRRMVVTLASGKSCIWYASPRSAGYRARLVRPGDSCARSF